MKSTPIFKDKVGDRKISTVFIEPWKYYETATWEPFEKKWVVHNWSRVDTLELAALMHEKAIEYAKEAK